jgi:8-oxo-dGTP pyrophosphatase MutT (NUDIX family)
MPGAPDARGRGRLRRAGRAHLTIREELGAALLTPEESLAIEVHGGRTDSAVLVPLFLDAAGDLHAVLTRRRDDLRRHAGEISFPGGRRDEGETLQETALREAHEEIGLPPGLVDVIGALAPVGTFVTNYRIYPFVGLIEPGFEWVLHEVEVAEVLELSLDDLVKGHSLKRLVRRGMAFKTDVYEVDGHMVWGATARILGDLLARTKGDPLLS